MSIRKVFSQGRELTIKTAKGTGICMMQLSRFRPMHRQLDRGLSTSAGPNRRSTRRTSAVRRTLLQVLSSQRVDRLGGHNGEWDVWDNAVAELEQLQKLTEWGWKECIQEFCSLFAVRVLVLAPDGSYGFGDVEAPDQCVVFFNGVLETKTFSTSSRQRNADE